MAYTEFYCDAANGSNLNSGSTTSASATYTSTGGNWTNATRVFTVTDGTNPSSLVNIGDYGAVYVTSGATVATFVGRITAVQNATNGTVTFSATFAGTNPSNGTGTMTLKVGGTWKGPNGSSQNSFPFNLTSMGANLANGNGDPVRINLKNNASYSISAQCLANQVTGGAIIQGYTSVPGDGGKAIIDTGSNAISAWQGTAGYTLADLEIQSSASSGNTVGINDAGTANGTYVHVVVHGFRNSGFRIGGGSLVYECEAYGNNTANTSTQGQRGGFSYTGTAGARFVRCYSHDNSGSNTYGFEASAGASFSMLNCIADSNGNDGFNLLINGTQNVHFANCDAYNNGGDGIGIDFLSGAATSLIIESCNLIKNTGKGINNTTAAGNIVFGQVFNCGYGSGTQANGGGDATLGQLAESGKVTYESGVTPYSAPTTGNFTINLPAAMNVGRGVFTETDGTNTGTVGYPDIGAAQHKDSQRGSTFGG